MVKILKFILFCAVIVVGVNQTKAMAQVTLPLENVTSIAHISKQEGTINSNYKKLCTDDENLSGLHATEQFINDALLPSNTSYRGGYLNKSFKLSAIFQALCTLEAQAIHEKSKRFDSSNSFNRFTGQSYVYLYRHILI